MNFYWLGAVFVNYVHAVDVLKYFHRLTLYFYEESILKLYMFLYPRSEGYWGILFYSTESNEYIDICVVLLVIEIIKCMVKMYAQFQLVHLIFRKEKLAKMVNQKCDFCFNLHNYILFIFICFRIIKLLWLLYQTET